MPLNCDRSFPAARQPHCVIQGTSALLLALLPVVASFGCRAFSSPDTIVAQYERSRERQQWWQANREQTKYVAGRGYFHPGTKRYYDASGQSLDESAGEIQQASFEDSGIAEEESDEGLDLSSLSLANINNTIKEVSGRGPNEDRARQRYAEAEKLFVAALNGQREDRDGQLADARGLFDDVIDAWPDSSLEEESMFKIGECDFFSDRYPRAIDAYGELIKKYPNTRHLELTNSRRFAICQYWLEQVAEDPEQFLEPNLVDGTRPRMDTFGSAVHTYDRIRIDDPTGDLADDATMASANAFFSREKYFAADELYADLREAFPRSEHQFQAHLLGLKCKLLIYQGAEYNDQPLEEAEVLVKQLRQQFPREVVAEREYIDRVYAEILAKRAEQDWEMAQYYERRKEFGGARHYYARVVEQFDGTQAAVKANERLAALGGLPNRPPDRFSWLTNAFEFEDEASRVASGGSSTQQR